MELIYQAISALFEIKALLLLMGGTFLGIVVGALPGLSATMGVAIASPLTYSMDPYYGIITLLGIYFGGIYGGSISAILLGIPGTPASVASTMDGYTMARKGFAGSALGIATISSFVGGQLSIIVLALVSFPIASFALSFGPREFLALAVFALTAIANLSGPSMLCGLFSAALGLFAAAVGIDEVHGTSRFTFGEPNLMGGISFIPVMIGLFALPESLQNIEQISLVARRSIKVSKILPDRQTLRGLIPAWLRSSVIGIIVGAIPGTGSDVGAIVGYSQGKNFSKQPEKFGTGFPEGLACAESANNAATGGSLIPLLTLGIPGGAASAIILGTFMIHGLKPGPLLLQNNADLVYKIFAGAFAANIFMIIFGLLGAKLFARVVNIPKTILSPIILLLCVVGSYAMRNLTFDVFVMFTSGIIGYIMVKVDIPRPPLIIGLILGPFVESELARSLMVVKNHWLSFFTPISTVLWILAVLPFLIPYFKRVSKRFRNNEN